MQTMQASLSTREVAYILNCSENTIRSMAWRNELPYYKVRNRFRFERSDIMQWVEESKKKHVGLSVDLF